MNKKTKKSFWPYGIIIFFLIVFTFNFFFLYQAIISNKGLVEENSYEKSLKYQDIIDLKTKSKELGWVTNLSYQSENIIIDINKINNKEVVFNQAEFSILPLNKIGDLETFKVDLILEKGNQKITISKKLTKGLWSVKIKFLNGEDIVYYVEKQIITE